MILNRTIRKKNDELHHDNIKNICFSKTTNTIKRQAAEWKKIFVIHASNEELKCRTYTHTQRKKYLQIAKKKCRHSNRKIKK